jgi:sialate O-acetylesterase
MKRIKTLLLIQLVFSFVICKSEVTLPRLISNGIVLQRDTELKIWGWASPDEPVRLAIGSSC